MGKGRRVWSIKQGIFGSYFLLIVILCTVVCISFLLLSQSVILDEIGQSRVDVLKQIAERTQAVKNSMITLSNLYSYDTNVTEALSLDEQEVMQNTTPLLANIRMLSIRYHEAYQDINLYPYVSILGQNGFQFCSQPAYRYDYDQIQVELWYDDVLHSNGNIYWISSFYDKNSTEEEKYVFSAARTLPVGNSDQYRGILLVNIDERQLYDTYANSLNDSNSIFIVDENGVIVSHQNQNMLGLNYYDMARFAELFDQDSFHLIQKGEEQYLLSNAYDPMTGWTIVEEIPVHDLLAPMNQLTITTIGIAILCLIGAFLLSYFVAYRTAVPVNNLCNKMEKVRQGDLHVTSEVAGWKEIRRLNEVFNQMMAETNQLQTMICTCLHG